MKKFLVLVLGLTMVLTACGGDDKPVSSEIDDKTEVVEEDPYEGMAINPLTGLYVDEEAADNRPVAVVINNAPKALPQSGINQGDIYYEVLAEGEITRMVVIFKDFDAEKIGPVRSARDYFTYFSLDNDDAIFVHHGGSPSGYASIKNRNIDDIDGMDCTAFWRDENRVNKPGMYEHSSYVDAAGILESAKEYGYETDGSTTGMFKFAEEEKTPSGEGGRTIELVFSVGQTSRFSFNDADGLYYRSQNGKDQIDELTGEAISVKNVIVQYADTHIIPGDEEGRREVNLVGSGTGYMFTNGNYEVISWTKTSYDSPTKWYGADGNELILNKGKTFICVYPEGKDIHIEQVG